MPVTTRINTVQVVAEKKSRRASELRRVARRGGQIAGPAYGLDGVDAGVEALHLVAPAVARGEDEHRHGAAGAPPSLEHRDAVHLGQADVEDDRVIGLAFAEKVTLLAVEGAVDHVAGVGERGREL